MSETLLVAIIGFVSAVAGSVIGVLASRQKTKAEATSAISDAAATVVETAVDDLLKPLTQRLDSLEAQVGEQQTIIERLRRLIDFYAKRLVYLMAGIETLIKQIKASNEIPCWTPDEWDPEKGTE